MSMIPSPHLQENQVSTTAMPIEKPDLPRAFRLTPAYAEICSDKAIK